MRPSQQDLSRAMRIEKAVVALKTTGHLVERVEGDEPRYRIDGCDPVTGPHLLAIALRLGLLDEPGRRLRA
ncbi:hypothetical protein MBRA_01023 [Methylobacterium brachiatum]|jgi:hypothetical protein|nr:hypothetical protein MBRA_01023 [Methylobacterium brachiatum]